MKLSLTHLISARLMGAASMVLAACLAACGGGTSVAGNPGSGGTGSYSSGAVSGFGSVILNNTRFADTSATVVNEDGETTDADKGALTTTSLKMGMIIDVDGGTVTASTVSGGLSSSTAHTIRYTNLIQGPVDSIDSTNITMLGQSVDVNAATVYEGVSSLAEASSSNCAYAEVYAFFNSATLRYSATRIECLGSQPATYRLFGPVSSLNSSASSFSINGLNIRYSGLSLPSGVQNGTVVHLRISTAWTSGNTAQATRLAISSKAGQQSKASAAVEGLITAYVSKYSFTVNGVPVTASSSTEFETETLANGSRVKVEGKLSNGVLAAKQVEEISDTDLEDAGQEVIGTVSNLDSTGKSFSLTTSSGRLFTVNYASVVDAPTLANGLKLEVEGKVASDGTTITASELELGDD